MALEKVSNKANLVLACGDYEAFQKATRRRLMQKQEMEANIAKKIHELVLELKEMASEETVDDEGLKMYNNLKKDGDAELE